LRRDGGHDVVTGRKWWAPGAPDRRCKILIVMGQTDPADPDPHRRQSMILVPKGRLRIPLDGCPYRPGQRRFKSPDGMIAGSAAPD
jgi:alkylation response protein AidB-like acyl-CoA dehydrogenase